MIDTDKVLEELAILHHFIDFVNKQVGVYMDCLAGFEGNIVRVSRQTARMQRAIGQRVENGQPVIVYTSVLDPTRPDVIHHRIVRADEFVAVNSERGFNEQQICWSIIVFLFAYWDERIRPQITRIRGVRKNGVRVDAMGDLRTIRKCIVHRKGVISASNHRKLKRMAELFEPDKEIVFSHDQMHKLFVIVKQAIAEVILEYTGHLSGAPDPTQIVDIAVQRNGRF